VSNDTDTLGVICETDECRGLVVNADHAPRCPSCHQGDGALGGGESLYHKKRRKRKEREREGQQQSNDDEPEEPAAEPIGPPPTPMPTGY
jgi:hypothetical protein